MNVLLERSTQQPPLGAPPAHELWCAIASLSLGGAEKIVLDWARRVAPPWRVHLVVLRDRVHEWPVPAGVRVTRLGGERIEAQLRELGAALVASGATVCLAHLLRAAERKALASAGARVVPVLHNAAAGWLEPARELTADPLVIAVSGACARELCAAGFGGQVSIIRHVPERARSNPEDRAALRQRWRIPLDACVIGMVGAIKPQKDYGRALAALAALQSRRSAYLAILGGPVGLHARANWHELLGEIERLGVRERVALPGFTPDASALLCAFDLLLNTSRHEGTSMATLEALVQGLPVVATHVGGQGELPSPSLTLVPPHAGADVIATTIDTALRRRAASPERGRRPDWATFPAHRLWTHAALGAPSGRGSRLTFVTANLNAGGAQRSLVNLVGALSGTFPIDVAVCGDSTAEAFQRTLAATGARVYRPAAGRDAFDHAEMLLSELRAGDSACVCYWNVDAKIKLLVTRALAASSIRLVDVSPGPDSFAELQQTAVFQRWLSFDADQYHARLDRLVLKFDGKSPPGCEGKRRVIPNGVLTNARPKQDYALGEAPRVVVSGRLAPAKMAIEAVLAMAHVWPALPRAELHFFGGAEPRHHDYGERLLRIAEDERDRRVFFHGPNADTSRLREFDVALVLGRGQGCPNALLEALALGLPTVANVDGGTPEQILHRETGLLISDVTPVTLAGALLVLLTDRALAERLGRSGRRHVVAHFGIERMARAYTELFRELGVVPEVSSQTA
jgi:glycosyltransferase involved in cell wall biosynthesis